MFNFLKHSKVISKDEIAKLLNTSPEMLAEFEESYKKAVLNDSEGLPDNFFKINAKQMAADKAGVAQSDEIVQDLIDRIVKELAAQTQVYTYKRCGSKESHAGFVPFVQENEVSGYLGAPVTKEEILSLPESIRPELSGSLMKKDTSGDAGPILLAVYRQFMSETNPMKKSKGYGIFRQGLDISDLDGIVYEMLGMNKTSMGYWLPKMAIAIKSGGFFKIPETKIIKVPISLLQLTRLDYDSHTRTTLDIVDRYCKNVFELNENKEYFIKTGTYSSKFDFRNAHVYGAREVRELGEYLLFIHTQALAHAHYDLSGRNQPVIYGMSTTNEWVAREFIPDKESNLTIYHGLPLCTEYRVFVDFDICEILGTYPYWDANVMKKRFDKGSDCNDPDMVHDAITFRANVEHLMGRYDKNVAQVCEELRAALRDAHDNGMYGQWSADIMQNGDDFWFIDKAPAEISAFYKECVPADAYPQCKRIGCRTCQKL